MANKNIEDIYPLSPMQHGMLFHTLLAPNSEVYFEQLDCTLSGNLNVSAFKRAWQKLVDRHPILRTVFIWKELDEPRQVVRQQIVLPWQEQDWRNVPSIRQRERLEIHLQADRRQGFDLSKGPLMRFALIRLTEKGYQFVWSYHHLLLDGWSLPLVLKEVFAYYEAFCRGQDLQLERLRPYRDYIAWLKQQDLSKAEAFWRRALKGFTAPTSLIFGKKAGQEWVGEAGDLTEQQVMLSAVTTMALQILAQKNQLTLNTLLQGAWALLLSRYSGEQDVVFGATVSGRPTELAGVETMIGLFINTLPVRVCIPSDGSLLPWLQDLQMQQAEIRQYEYSSLAQIQRWSELPRGTPPFENILVFENYPVDNSMQVGQGGLELGNIRIFEKTNYPLMLTARPGSELLLKVVYNNRRFDAPTISHMLEHLQTLLEEIVAEPEQCVSILALLTSTERHQVLDEWNDTKIAYHSQERCIHELFEIKVNQMPDAVVVVFENQYLTYGELNKRANQLAHYLRKQGIGPEILVGISVDRSLEMVVGLMGILKAGGAYVPMDPAYPKERLTFMLEDAQVPVLLTQQHLLENLPAYRAQVICLDTGWEAIVGESTEDPVHQVMGRNLAYVIYTSGSTGRPKGAMNTHGGIYNRLLWKQETYQLTETDRVLQKTPFSFDVSVWEFFWPLLTGACLIVARPEGHKDSAYLVDLITKQSITTLHFVPSMLRIFLEEVGLEACSSLKRVICSGETLLFDLQERFFARLNAELHNLYGPTEAAIDVTFWACKRESDQPVVPIGRPIANMQIYLLGAHLQPVPIGVLGELHISGVGLARGYWKRPRLTAEKFIPNPFNAEPNMQLYKSGDLARYLPDGNIEFLGRVDYQVKVHGYRIELGEIEAMLIQHPGVQEAVVVAREDEPDDKRLVAYIVGQDGQAPTGGKLRSFLQKKLPQYMVPSTFVVSEALPLTPNGKVDRRALPVPDTARPELEEAFTAPRTPLEESLAEIWAEVLKLERVGIHDNFLELGGDSILSLQIAARANRIGLQIVPRLLFENQTIAELAEAINITDAVWAEQKLVTGPVPLTPIQHLFFEQNLPNLHHFNQSILLEVPRSLAPALVEQSFQLLLRHHDALRLRFVKHVSGWQQTNARVGESPVLTQIDLSLLSHAEQGYALEATAKALQTSLNLAKGPLLRVGLFDLGLGQSNRLLITIHHLAVDGVSWRILLEDLQTAYQQLSRDETVQLPPKTTSFKRWAEQLVKYARSGAPKQELDYWLAMTQTQVFPLPVDRPFSRDDNTRASARTISVSLSAGETQAILRKVPATYHTQINDVLLMALAQVCARWTGECSILIDLEAHGREKISGGVDVSRTVGWFTAIFPVLLTLPDSSDLENSLSSIKEQLRRIPNRGIGYGLLRYLGETSIVQKLRNLPQPEVSFNYLGQWDQTFDETSLFRPAPEASRAIYSQEGKRRHLLEINGLIAGGQLRVDWTYSERIHHRVTIEHLAQSFVDTLQALIICSQSAKVDSYIPSDFPDIDLTEEKLGKVLAELNLGPSED